MSGWCNFYLVSRLQTLRLRSAGCNWIMRMRCLVCSNGTVIINGVDVFRAARDESGTVPLLLFKLRLPLAPPLTLQEKQPSVEMILSLDWLYGSKPLGPYSYDSPPLDTGVMVEIQWPFSMQVKRVSEASTVRNVTCYLGDSLISVGASATETGVSYRRATVSARTVGASATDLQWANNVQVDISLASIHHSPERRPAEDHQTDSRPDKHSGSFPKCCNS